MMSETAIAPKRRVVSDPFGYSAVLAAAYLSMALCWDLLRNDGQLFQNAFATAWGLGLLTTIIVLHAILQTTYRQLNTAFSALLATALFAVLIVLGFSYIYAVNGVCTLPDNAADCLYFSVSVVTAVAGNATVPTGQLALYSAWQAILSVFVFLMLVVQTITFTQEYRRIQRIAQPL